MRATTRPLFAAALLSTLAFGCGSSGDTGGGDGNGNGNGNSGSSSGGGGHDSGVGSSSGGSGGSSGGSSGGAANDGGADDGADDGGGAFVPADHPPFPILQKGTGTVMATPSVQAVFFKDYDQIPGVTAMLQGLPAATLATGASYWQSAVGEYGVGALTVLPPITVTDTAPTTDTDPKSYLSGKMSDPAFKNVTANTIIALFYPSTTPLKGSCAATTPGFGGYHDSFNNAGHAQPYAVMTECAKFGPITSALDMVTVAGSHEIIEAVTDPNPAHATYVNLDSTEFGVSMGAFLQGNAENGDLCTINTGFGRGPSSYPYLLQRGWSNAAAKAGKDPCAPDLLPAQPYVGAYPVMPDALPNVDTNAKGVIIPVQQSKTIDVKLFSLAPTADFTVAARQASDVIPPTLDFSWDKTTGHNGDTLHLTIKALGDSGQGGETFVVTAALPGMATSDTQKAAWAGIVTHQ
jgi:hypothetical protein